MANESKSFIVDARAKDVRIDRFLRDALEFGRRDAWDLIARRAVILTRSDRIVRPLRKSECLQAGDKLEVDLGALARAEPDPTVIPPILFESDLVVVCEKVPGLPSGALRTESRQNLASGLLARYPEMAQIGHSRLEPGLIHRLDTETSGLVVAARTLPSFEKLTRALKNGSLTKEYLAVVAVDKRRDTDLEPGLELSFESDIGPDPKNPKRVQVSSGARFRTEAQVLKRAERRALLVIRAPCAYRHQIRVHLAELGLPLVGDATYGSWDLTGAPRHALHAHYVASSETPAFCVRSPLPADLETLMREPGSSFDSSD